MLLFLFAEIAARSSELEVIVYNDTTGVDMVAQQYQTPTSESWPKNYSVLASGSVVVYQASAPSGKTRFCVDFQSSSSAPWHTTCMQANSTNDIVYGVMWANSNYAIGVYLNTNAGFNSNFFLDSDSFPAASGSCAVTCDDGSSCSANCSSSGCEAGCSPNAYCRCRT